MEIVTVHWVSDCGTRSQSRFTTKSFIDTAMLAGLVFSATAYSRFPNTLGGLEQRNITHHLESVTDWGSVLQELVSKVHPSIRNVESHKVEFDIIKGGLYATFISLDDSFISFGGFLAIDKYTGSAVSSKSKYDDVTMHLHFKTIDSLMDKTPIVTEQDKMDIKSIIGKQSSGIKPLLSYYNSPTSAGDFQKYHSLSTS